MRRVCARRCSRLATVSEHDLPRLSRRLDSSTPAVSRCREDEAPQSATKLFTPIAIGGVEVPNRIVLPAMTTRLADEGGQVTEAMLAYYRVRAIGGVGLLTVEMSSPE